MDKFGRIDILFNNAGINKLEPIWEIKDETWDLVMNVCLRGTMWTMRAAIPHMIKQGKGAIVNMASAAGWIASSGGEAPYSAAKAGVMGLTRAAAGELAGKGIRVNAIAPSVIYNEFLERIYPKSMFEGAKKRNPMGRLGEPRRGREPGVVPRERHVVLHHRRGHQHQRRLDRSAIILLTWYRQFDLYPFSRWGRRERRDSTIARGRTE